MLLLTWCLGCFGPKLSPPVSEDGDGVLGVALADVLIDNVGRMKVAPPRLTLPGNGGRGR